MLLLAVACQRGMDLPEATSAAHALSLQYADRPDLTVAFIGDYKKDTDTYNTVMFQAQDSASWHQLCQEFGLDRSRLDLPDTLQVKHMVVASMSLPDDQSADDIDALVDSVLQTILPSETAARASAQISTIQPGDTIPPSLETLFVSHSRLMAVADDDGKAGYVASADPGSLTLWLFFYSSRQELSHIFDIIK